MCDLDIVLDNSGSDDLQELTLTNMLLPLFVFVMCSILAIGFDTFERRSSKNATPGSTGSFAFSTVDPSSYADGLYLGQVQVPEQPRGMAPERPSPGREGDNDSDMLMLQSMQDNIKEMCAIHRKLWNQMQERRKRRGSF